jgi:hypothetical protein
MVLRSALNMYCNCATSSSSGGKCNRPTICAEKVCASTVDADFLNSFVIDTDELNADIIHCGEIIIKYPTEVTQPTLTLAYTTGQSPTTVMGSLPAFSTPINFTTSTAASELAVPDIEGSGQIGSVKFNNPIPAGTMLSFDFGTNPLHSDKSYNVSFTSQILDLAKEGYVLPMMPVVVTVTSQGFMVLFPDAILSETSTWGYQIQYFTPI